MRNLFRTRPTTEFENYTAKHIGAGKGYHQRFTVNPGRAMMWELEKIALRDIVSGLRPRKVLDFACGTGRIASFIESTFPEPSVHGIDISESMLAIARGQSVRTRYELMDAQQALLSHGEKSFDLILAFRFFANAEPSLRQSVAPSLSRLLSDDGTLVINNHRNFWSTSYVGRRLVGQNAVGALNGNIERIFADQGLRSKRRISLGVWPQGDTRALLLPWKAVEVLERANLASFASHHTLGYNTLWVMARH